MLAPVIRGRKGEYVDLFGSCSPRASPAPGSTARPTSLDNPPKLDKQKKHTIEVVVDRLAVKESSKRRLTDSVETALNLAGGLVSFDFVDLDAKDPRREMRFSEKMACPNEHAHRHRRARAALVLVQLARSAPARRAHGLGTRMEVDPELVVPDPTATLAEGASSRGARPTCADYFLRLLGALGEELGFDLNTPWEDLPAKARKSILEGHPTKVHVVTPTATAASAPTTPQFEGVRPYIERRHREAESDTSRERFEGYMREVPCPACKGSRLKPVSMAVTIGRQRRTSPRCARCRSTRPPTSCATST